MMCYSLNVHFRGQRVKLHVFYGWTALVGLGLLFVEVSISHQIRHSAFGRTLWTSNGSVAEIPLPATQNTHTRQTLMPPAGFEPAIPACEEPQTHALHRAATATIYTHIIVYKSSLQCKYYTLQVLFTNPVPHTDAYFST